ncbi:choline kinase [Schizosaccharomyces cryophilus OY26]|uniref:Choline kinase n=1 Tax=Schizosaccharomyces cryophilus (strain OY26 / ATCC MYA-4695 / CBS 11777 / NBRC 106824 / NRRL Y48691) TaxID=653667 RepID=S9W0C3_SCHCR|nr:choline kinase [Schizosaccharomyces cryophilus OY26]EPY51829.1 choline kinase [Schizosaccharomyces cryophilus OY26]
MPVLSDEEDFCFDNAYVSKKCKSLLHTEDPDHVLRHKVLLVIHKLAIPTWSRVPVASHPTLIIRRISGALTNAVYYIAPPEGCKAIKLLLRIYGPNVEMFINRFVELENLKRLAKHNIGPRLLGEFGNGRFEQYMESTTLTPETIRDPTCSIYVARRISELHYVIQLSPTELYELPNAWKFCFSWLPLARRNVQNRKHSLSITTNFLDAVEKDFHDYFQWFNNWASDKKHWPSLQLVFSHNDTQYGNILQIKTKRRSFKPENRHHILVPVDFEYAGPNIRAYDIANYFAEWMANYHHPTQSHMMDRSRYPSSEARKRFYRAYVEQSAVLFKKLVVKDASELTSVLPESLKLEFDTSVQQLEEAVRAISPAVNAVWALWGVMQCEETDDDWEDLSVSSEREDKSDSPPSKIASSNVPPIGSTSFDYINYSMEKFNLFYETCAALGLNANNRSTFSYD